MEATLNLTDQSGVAEARRETLQMAKRLGLSERRQADAALVVTEAATNILKYAGHGRIVLDGFASEGAAMLHIVALDQGPGIANLAAASADGFSTGGSLGAGLGTIARHSAVSDVYSVPGNGTAVFAQIGEVDRGQPSTLSIGIRSTPKSGQQVNGDGWSVRTIGANGWIALLDGLGHGPLAADATRAAVAAFQAAPENAMPPDILHQAHADLKATRGAVMAVAAFDHEHRIVSYAGVGNITAIVATGMETNHLLSTDGTVGYNMRMVRQHQLPWRKDAVFIASTDGLSTRWNLSRHPGLLQKHPSLIASVLHRDFARDADDATVLVVKAI